MIEGKTSEQRHVVPRWRTLNQSQISGEFDSVRSHATSRHIALDGERVMSYLRRDFEAEKKAWLKTEHISSAEELLTSAIALGERDDPAVLSAAIAVSSVETTAPAMAAFSEEIVHGRIDRSISPTLVSVAKLRSEIAIRKHLLSLNPRDGLLVAEMALLHLNLGQDHKTKSLLRRAQQVLPNHRYVLRAAARFWCHEGKPDKALSILRGSERTNIDPWLKAAEMATEAITGSSPSKWKVAKDLVRSGRFSPRALSELASQIGTFELKDGSKKQAMEMLRIGATSPTENAIAQIEFVGRETASFEPDELIGSRQDAYEASAHKAYWRDQWDEALEACESWHLIEPFSTRPAIFGTFVASVRSTSLERGLALAMAVHNANPNDPLLLNNLAVIHAYMGNVNEATQALKLSKATFDADLLISNKATEGLIEFRTGNFSEGSKLYQAAINDALDKKKYISALRAYCFLGREMTRVGSEWAEIFGSEVDRTVNKLRKRGVPIPRDVEIIRAQYVNTIPNDFGPLSLTGLSLSNGIE